MMVSETYFCIQLKLTMKSRTCENEEGEVGIWAVISDSVLYN